MQRMEADYGFVASSVLFLRAFGSHHPTACTTDQGPITSTRMYKAKFAMWKFSKIIRHDFAKKVLEAAETRRGKPTEVVVRDSVIPLSRVKESYERYCEKFGENHVQGMLLLGWRDLEAMTEQALHADDMRPPDLSNFTLRTPKDTSIVPSPGPERPAADLPCAQNAWTPSHITNQQVSEQDSGGLLRTDWRGMSLKQLHQLKWEAARLDAEGRTGEAEGLFAGALSGFRHLLTPTHELTVKAAYQLAAFYANHDRMADADKVLHWLSESHISRWGPDHDRTLTHYIRIVLLLHAWSRREHAEVLVFRITEALQNSDVDGLAASAPRIPGDDQAHIHSAVDELDEDTVNEIFAESAYESRVDAQLRIADLWVASGSSIMERILPQLIEQCDRYPDRLSVQGMQARCSLLKLCVMQGKREEVSEVFLQARRALARLVSGYPEAESGTIPETVLSVARKLAFLHLDNQDQRNCDRVLTWVANRLERLAGTDVVRKEPAGMAAVGFLTQAGKEYQQRSGWQGAAPWIEWAYGICSRMLGPNHSRTRALEEAIRNKRYELFSSDLAMRLLAPSLVDITIELV